VPRINSHKEIRCCSVLFAYCERFYSVMICLSECGLHTNMHYAHIHLFSIASDS